MTDVKLASQAAATLCLLWGEDTYSLERTGCSLLTAFGASSAAPGSGLATQYVSSQACCSESTCRIDSRDLQSI